VRAGASDEEGVASLVFAGDEEGTVAVRGAQPCSLTHSILMKSTVFTDYPCRRRERERGRGRERERGRVGYC
jgi:hypothetical protein